jgi:hypothetical protein
VAEGDDVSIGLRDDAGGRARRAYWRVLLGPLDGIKLTSAEQLVDWLALRDEWTVTVTAALIGAARAAGPAEVRRGR